MASGESNSLNCAKIEADLKKILLQDDGEGSVKQDDGKTKEAVVKMSNGEQHPDSKNAEQPEVGTQQEKSSQKNSDGGDAKNLESTASSQCSSDQGDKKQPSQKDDSTNKTMAVRKKKQRTKLTKKKPVKAIGSKPSGDDEGEVTAKRQKTSHDNNSGAQKEQDGSKSHLVDSSAGANRQFLENPTAPLDHTNPKVEKLRALIAEEVHPLKKRSARFPRAAYFCRLCEYHCDTVSVCEKHIRDKRHKRLREVKDTDHLLKKLPKLSQLHIRALNKAIDRTVEMSGLTREATEHRQMLVKKLEKLVQTKLPDVKLELYGSSVNGFGLKTSDVNIDIVIPDGASAAETLTTIFKLLKGNDSYAQVKNDFSAKIPAIYFKDPVTDVVCQLSVGNALAQQTTKLLAAYCKIDERVRKLGVAFRYLAKLCQMDQQQDGTLPAYSFSLMTVYYLQRSKPSVLPVLQELLPKGSETRPEVLIEGKDCWFYDDIDQLKETWTSSNKESVAELWVNMLRFYSVQFDMNNHVVCLRMKRTVTRDEKKWSYKKLAIEDPFSCKRSVSRSVSHNKNFDYILDRFKTACKYFGVPQTRNGPLYWRLPPSSTGKSNSTFREPEPGDLSSKPSQLCPATVTEHILPKESLTANKQSFTDLAAAMVDLALDEVRKKVDDQARVQTLPEIHTDDLGNIKEVLPKENDDKKLPDADLKVEKKAENILFGSMGDAFMDILDSKANEKIKSSVVSDPKGNIVMPTKEDCDSHGDDLRLFDDKSKTVENGTDIREISSGASSQEDVPESCREARLTGNIDVFAGKYVAHVMHKAVKDIEGGESAGDAFTTEEDSTQAVPFTYIRSKFGRTDSVDRYGDDDDEEEDLTEIMDAVVGSPEPAEEQLIDDQDMGEVIDGSWCFKKEGCYSEKLLENLKPKDIVFIFESEKLTDGKKPAIMCSICQKEGHLKQDCPEENLPQISKLPPLSEDNKKLLNDLLLTVPDDFMPSEKEINMRKEILTELETFIREIYPECNLCMFGSSCNGFGFKNSDLDICMTLSSHDSPKNLDCVEIIEKLATKLKLHKGLSSVFAITTAKVPIVKFKHRKSQIEGDISLYNTLALYNTKMLENYSIIDKRVKVLGYIMKVFAKVCDIGDASRGSLSSYAYILMVLYYLQHCKPPVIPVLQELCGSKPKPQVIIDGCNTWFYDEIPNLADVWEDYGKNTQTVGELWLGLLKFYTELFNFKEHVVSIRQLKPLTRFEKLWNGKSIAIEDPFDLTHNLGAGLSRKMNTYIMKAFINGRHLFGKPVDPKQEPAGYTSFLDYFFDVKLLVDGQPPNDRGCRACGKIGHFARECPIAPARKDREKAGRDPDRDKKDKDRKDQKHDEKHKQRDRDHRKALPPSQQRMPFPKPPIKNPLPNQPRQFPVQQFYYNSNYRMPFRPPFGEGRGFPHGAHFGQRGFYPPYMNRNMIFGERPPPPPHPGRPSPERFSGPKSNSKSAETSGRGAQIKTTKDEKTSDSKTSIKDVEKQDKTSSQKSSNNKNQSAGEKKSSDASGKSSGSASTDPKADLVAQEKLQRGIGQGYYGGDNRKEVQEKAQKPGLQSAAAPLSKGDQRGQTTQKPGMGAPQQNLSMQGRQQNQNRPFNTQARPGPDRQYANRPGPPVHGFKSGSSIQEQFHAIHGARPPPGGVPFAVPDRDHPGTDRKMEDRNFTGGQKTENKTFSRVTKEFRRDGGGHDNKPSQDNRDRSSMKSYSHSHTIIDSQGRKVESQDIRNLLRDNDNEKKPFTPVDRSRERNFGRSERAPSQEKDKSFAKPVERPATGPQGQDRSFASASNKDRPFSSPQKASPNASGPSSQHSSIVEQAGRTSAQPLFTSPKKQSVAPASDQPGPKPVNRTLNMAPIGRAEKRPFPGPHPWRQPAPGQVNILQRPPGGGGLRPPLPHGIIQREKTELEQKSGEITSEIVTSSSSGEGKQSVSQPPSITQYSHDQTPRPLLQKDGAVVGHMMHSGGSSISGSSSVANQAVSPSVSSQQLFTNTSPGHTSPCRPDHMKDVSMRKRRSPPKEAPPPRFQKLRQQEHQVSPQETRSTARPPDTAPSPNPPSASAYLQPSSIPQPMQQSPQQQQLTPNFLHMTPQMSALLLMQSQQRIFQNQPQQQQPQPEQKEPADVFGQRPEPNPFGPQILNAGGFQGHVFPLQQQQHQTFDTFREQSQSQAEPGQTQNFPEKSFSEQYPPHFQSQEQASFDQSRQGDVYFRDQLQPQYFDHRSQYSPQNQESFYHPATQHQPQQSSSVTGTHIWFSTAAQQQQSQHQPQQQHQAPQQQQHFSEENNNPLFTYNLGHSRSQLSPNTQTDQGVSQGLHDSWPQQTVFEPWPRSTPQQYPSLPQSSEPSQISINSRITPDELSGERDFTEPYHAQMGFGGSLNLDYHANH